MAFDLEDIRDNKSSQPIAANLSAVSACIY
jgi:hypothetical protein